MKSDSKRKLLTGRSVPENVRRILIVKPSSLGDIFHTFPAIACLRELFPQAEFDWMVHPAFADALDYSPAPVSRKILFRRQELGRIKTFLPAACELIRELRMYPYDYIFDFQGLFRSALFARTARGRVVGFARPREMMARWFYNHWSLVNLRLHAVRRNQLLVERFFHTGFINTTCTLPSNPDNRESLSSKLERSNVSLNDMLIGISPGARWPSKMFPPELFAKVISHTAELLPQARFVIMGAPADQKVAEQIRQLANLPQVVSLAGATNLGELVELVNNCRAVLANDSGPVHIAAAAKIPVVCFYGPTNPNLTGPFGDMHTVFQRNDLECIKCMHRQCSRITTECHNIDAAAVANAICGKIQK